MSNVEVYVRRTWKLLVDNTHIILAEVKRVQMLAQLIDAAQQLDKRHNKVEYGK